MKWTKKKETVETSSFVPSFIIHQLNIGKFTLIGVENSKL